jgi:hypothetical protein
LDTGREVATEARRPEAALVRNKLKQARPILRSAEPIREPKSEACATGRPWDSATEGGPEARAGRQATLKTGRGTESGDVEADSLSNSNWQLKTQYRLPQSLRKGPKRLDLGKKTGSELLGECSEGPRFGDCSHSTTSKSPRLLGNAEAFSQLVRQWRSFWRSERTLKKLAAHPEEGTIKKFRDSFICKGPRLFNGLALAALERAKIFPSLVLVQKVSDSTQEPAGYATCAPKDSAHTGGTNHNHVAVLVKKPWK